MTAGDAGAGAPFRAAYGREPDVVWRCPGRVNLIGDHTDHQGGLALPLAIDRYVTVAVARRADGVVRVRSADFPHEVRGPVSERPESGGWAAYVLGAAWLLHRRGAPGDGADVFVSSTVPVGAGLSSSAAVTCASVRALADLSGVRLDLAEVARVAQQVETDVVGAPVGLLDQTAVLFAAAGTALLLDFATGGRETVPLPGDPWRLVVVDTRVSHAHAGGEYADRRRLLDEARQRLAVASLSDLGPADVDRDRGALGSAYRAVRHVVTENDRVRRTADALRRRNFREVGALMVQSHESLRDDLEVSCPELDLAVGVALDAGAAGARMTGGGFGGSAIVLATSDVGEQLTSALDRAFAAAGFAAPAAFPVAAVDGARLLTD
ncbi:MAG TPA: galactokinase [Mycobacteriales bacterium]